uniref:Gustatory receptor n=1 Tax=Ditylenchus dipsaci TaxID=166011 RepID=A0A915DPV1_9BILA
MSSHNFLEACKTSEQLENYLPLRICHFLEIVLNLLSIVLLIKHLPWKRLRDRRLPAIHINFTILFANGFVLYFVHAFFILVTAIVKELRHFVNPRYNTTKEFSSYYCFWKLYKGKIQDYSLLKSYQIAENGSITRILLTLSFIHSIAFTSYLILTCIGRNVLESSASLVYISVIEFVHLILTIYILTTLCMATYLKGCAQLQTIVKIPTSKEQADVYFMQFARQISTD